MLASEKVFDSALFEVFVLVSVQVGFLLGRCFLHHLFRAQRIFRSPCARGYRQRTTLLRGVLGGLTKFERRAGDRGGLNQVLRRFLIHLCLNLDLRNSLSRTLHDGLVLNHLLHVLQLQSDSDVDELALFSGSLEKDFLLSDRKQDFLSVGGQLRQNLGRLIR